MDKKRLLGIIGFVLLCLVFGVIIYRVFFAPKDTGPTSNQFTTIDDGATGGDFPVGDDADTRNVVDIGTGVLPDSGISDSFGSQFDTEEILSQTRTVVDDAVVGSAVDGSGNLRFYNQTDGKFYRIGANGQPEPIGDEVFFNVEQVTWANNSDESIIEYPDGANIYYDFDKKKQVTLPKHWESFSFSPNSDRVTSKSIGLSPENRWLISSAPDGSSIRLIEPLGDNGDKVDVAWSPNNQVVAFSRTGSPLGGERQEILLVGLNDENFPSIVVEGRGFESTWSPTGDQLIYSVFSSRSDFKPELWVVNSSGSAIGSGRKPLGLNTWSDKCTFASNRTLYCAVPRELERGAGYAPGLANETADLLYKIDLQTGSKTQLSLDAFHVIDELFVGDDDSLYFTDKGRPGVFEVAI